MDELFPYQNEGVDWISEQRWALLADEMGLGKTVQAIRGLDRIRAKSALVICPSVARINWAREVDMWTQTQIKLRVLTNLSERPNPGESCVCSFDYATANFEALSNTQWDCLIIDEAHFLKSNEAQRAKAILGKNGIVRSAKRCWMLTGTPAPNNASELWIMLFTFGITPLKFDDFVKHFCNVRETSYGLKIDSTNADRIPELQDLLAKIILRRLKKDVMNELPEIFYSHVVVDPGLVEFEILPGFINYFVPVPMREKLFDQIAREKKLLSNVFNNVKGGDENVINAVSAIAESVSTLRRVVGLQKVEAVVEMISNELEANAYKKIVVFAIHRDVIEGIRAGLVKFKPVTLYGGTPPEKRQKNIDKFQKDDKCRVFIGNIQASGTAITLTASSEVLFVEQDWVPGNNAQAVMRVHRIGQAEKVRVRYVGLADSIDTQIMYILKKKTRDLTLIFDEDSLKEARQKYRIEKREKDKQIKR